MMKSIINLKNSIAKLKYVLHLLMTRAAQTASQSKYNAYAKIYFTKYPGDYIYIYLFCLLTITYATVDGTICSISHVLHIYTDNMA